MQILLLVLSAAGGGIAACAASRIGWVRGSLLDQETAAVVLFHKFDRGALQISQCLAINDDLYAMAGINLVAVSDLVIQGHAVLWTPSTNPCDEYSQGMTFKFLVFQERFDGNGCFWGQGDVLCVFHGFPVR